MNILLEHIHLNVHSIEATEQFLLAAMPEFKRRGGNFLSGYGEWVHLGTEDCYVALTESPGTKIPQPIRHIGLVTENIDALIARMEKAGYQPSDRSEMHSHPHRRRIYFIDRNGLSWEFIEYLSFDVSRRNDYS
jgi:hypothetical protein